MATPVGGDVAADADLPGDGPVEQRGERVAAVVRAGAEVAGESVRRAHQHASGRRAGASAMRPSTGSTTTRPAAGRRQSGGRAEIAEVADLELLRRHLEQLGVRRGRRNTRTGGRTPNQRGLRLAAGREVGAQPRELVVQRAPPQRPGTSLLAGQVVDLGLRRRAVEQRRRRGRAGRRGSGRRPVGRRAASLRDRGTARRAARRAGRRSGCCGASRRTCAATSPCGAASNEPPTSSSGVGVAQRDARRRARARTWSRCW